jgi:molecular chaperone DnaJ
MTAAALGTHLTLPLLEADLPTSDETDAEERPVTTYDLDIRPGTQSGSEQVLRGFGVPSLRGGRGDLVVSISVDTPTRLDPRQEELLRELAAIRGEEAPDGQNEAPTRSMFGRLRDAFQG